jgi:spore coat protein A, manganese oxidase
MKLSRRDLVKLGLLSSGAILLPVGCNLRKPNTKKSETSLDYFERSLVIPPTLAPVRQDATTDYYEMTVRRDFIELIPGIKTEIWGYNGITPGPTIRQKGGSQAGRKSVVRFINQLDKDSDGEPLTTVSHLHGMASLPQYDGHTMDVIAPGYYKDYHYPNDLAGTLWYHDHSMDKTARNVQMGLAGMYIVEDDYERSLPLPKGEYDIPLMLQNKRLATDGTLFRDLERQTLYREIDLVNGVPWPYFEVTNRKYRFRILNASASRSYRLVLSQSATEITPESITVIGSDGGLLEAPVEVKMPTDALRASSAERYDIIVDFSKYPVGSQLFLHHARPAKGKSSKTALEIKPIMRFDIVGTVADSSQIPPTFRPIERVKVTPDLPQRKFVFNRENGKWVINRRGWEHHHIEANPDPGSTEIWTFVNPQPDKIHPIHLHLAKMQLIDRNGKPPRPYERGWKDTFRMGEGETLRAIVQFPSRDGKPIEGKYMMHCHDLDHEDNAMMIQFEVGKNGPDPVATAPALPYK